MKLIFDIGYNKGEFTRACREKHPDAFIVGVEANPGLCDVESKDNFVLLNYLVGAKTGDSVDFYVNKKHSGVSTASETFMRESRFCRGSRNLRKRSERWDKPIKVTSITLDSLMSVYGVPDFIKIDVEGYELQVLNGLTQKAKDICFEWHEELDVALYTCLLRLELIGYKEVGVVGYFDEGDEFDFATYSSKGDPYLEYPKDFYTFDNFEIERLVKPERRINYGMIFAR